MKDITPKNETGRIYSFDDLNDLDKNRAGLEKEVENAAGLMDCLGVKDIRIKGNTCEFAVYDNLGRTRPAHFEYPNRKKEVAMLLNSSSTDKFVILFDFRAYELYIHDINLDESDEEHDDGDGGGNLSPDPVSEFCECVK